MLMADQQLMVATTVFNAITEGLLVDLERVIRDAVLDAAKDSKDDDLTPEEAAESERDSVNYALSEYLTEHADDAANAGWDAMDRVVNAATVAVPS